jgi:hypothetical protein
MTSIQRQQLVADLNAAADQPARDAAAKAKVIAMMRAPAGSSDEF